jgi:PhnB protein
MPVSPYVQYPGTCREALALYARAFGGEPRIMLRSQGPADPAHPETEATRDLVMHSTLAIHGTTVMFADNPPDEPFAAGQRITLMVHGMAPEEIDRAFAVLAEGGRVTMPAQKTFWSERYGSLVDRFGIGWQLSAEQG